MIIRDFTIDVKISRRFPLTSRRSTSDNGNEKASQRLSRLVLTRLRESDCLSLSLSFFLPAPFLSFTFPIHLFSCSFHSRVSPHSFNATIAEIAIHLNHTPRDISGLYRNNYNSVVAEKRVKFYLARLDRQWNAKIWRTAFANISAISFIRLFLLSILPRFFFFSQSPHP